MFWPDHCLVWFGLVWFVVRLDNLMLTISTIPLHKNIFTGYSFRAHTVPKNKIKNKKGTLPICRMNFFIIFDLKARRIE
jgi:hypothetical protein